MANQSFSIEVKGLKPIKKALAVINKKYRNRVVKKSLRQGINIVAKQARRNAPRSQRNVRAILNDSGNRIPLKKGIKVMTSRIHNGRRSKLIGMHLFVLHKKRGQPYYGRFVEDGYNVHGKRPTGSRINIRSVFGSRSGRATEKGRSNVPGQRFIGRAWQTHRITAVNKTVEVANREIEKLFKQAGLK